MLGSTLINAMSSKGSADAPSGPFEKPSCEPHIFTLALFMHIDNLIWSQLLYAIKTACETAYGIFPSVDKPAAIEHIFCSAIPVCMNLWGNFSAKSLSLVDSAKSADRTTTDRFFSANSITPSPKPSLGDLAVALFKNTSWFNFNLAFSMGS